MALRTGHGNGAGVPWKLDPGVARALRIWVKMREAGPEDLMFVDADGGALTADHRLAEELRAALLVAGVDRHELHHDGKNTGKLRVHDLRGTFVTLSLANGHTETWVADRTGHKSSQMIQPVPPTGARGSRVRSRHARSAG